MSFSKLRTNGGNKVFKLDVQFFHQKQPNCVLDLQEATTKNEENIAKGTTDPGVDYFNQLLWFDSVELV